jgi:hypothetical protein
VTWLRGYVHHLTMEADDGPVGRELGQAGRGPASWDVAMAAATLAAQKVAEALRVLAELLSKAGLSLDGEGNR